MQVTCLPRLDVDADEIRARLIPHCRLKPGDIWHDPHAGHVIGCGDGTDRAFVRRAFNSRKATLAVLDPPYNLVMFEKKAVSEYIAWCRSWIDCCSDVLSDDSSLYVWLGADQKDHFQPLPQFMTMMAATGFESRAFITLRNQRGYGTQKNWMAIRQELLYYTRGKPLFAVQYTDIPKVLRGYYKQVAGRRTENLQRSRSNTIRAGNVWVDIQQVFYRRQENVNGCYAQKPLAAIERIVLASSVEGDLVTDFFAHSGSTLLACERTSRQCLTFDVDPVFTEIAIRRLEQYRSTGRTGWQAGHPFEQELGAVEAAVPDEPVSAQPGNDLTNVASR